MLCHGYGPANEKKPNTTQVKKKNTRNKSKKNKSLSAGHVSKFGHRRGGDVARYGKFHIYFIIMIFIEMFETKIIII